ncbi:hypothetical protein Ppa06_44190 [Planomonospora parontospora subsp. parontospora]|uniref:Uncharacterized protein n=2 Tax=Planomonospora parontospora TaxID=58119 RepID=A0AA37BKH9_9ACTN|nr:hypothetical protein GCM10010126_50050 [Planomonospora parontospora]GII10621.1 hypothetical protein Ppa06_44190 [Planomonospora parontospora subsp. parontospora]
MVFPEPPGPSTATIRTGPHDGGSTLTAAARSGKEIVTAIPPWCHPAARDPRGECGPAG